MLHILTGKSGTGKTQYLYNKINKLINKNSSKDVYFLVPEQYEFETEKQLLIHMQAQNFAKVKITTFTKIAKEINILYGTPKDLADEIVKKTSSYLAIKTVMPKLKYYVKTARKPAFATTILDVISMLKGANITPSILAEKVHAMPTDSSLYRKLWDISLIFSAYNAIIEKSYNELPDELRNASANASANDFFVDKIFIVDGFDSFSGGQFDFLKALFEECYDSYLAITTDNNSDSYLFYSVNKIVNQLQNIENEIVIFDEFKRFKSNELLHLAENFQQNYTNNYTENCDNIQVILCEDYYKEAEFVASKIHQKVMQGSRYKDFVILSADPNGYLPAFESTFEKYKIPIFFDIPQPISSHPLTKQVLALFDVILNMSTESVLRYIKSGFVRVLNDENRFSTLTLYQINSLEEFSYIWELGSKNWTNPFVKMEVVNGEKVNVFHKENQLREKIIEPIIELKNKINGKNGAEITEAISEFLIDKIDIKGAIKAYCYINSDDDFSDEINPLDNLKVNEYHQIWELILSIFEGMHKSFDGKNVNLNDYYSLLKNIFSSTDCAKPPQFIDSVLFGSVGRTRSSEVKYAFIIGCNDGVFPKSTEIGTTFNENEIEMMNVEGIDLGIDRKSRYSQQLFSAYRSLTLPTTELFLSFSIMNSSGESLEKSEVIDEIMAMFPLQNIVKSESFGEDFYCTNESILKQRLAIIYRENSVAKASLVKIIDSKESEFLKKINSVFKLQGENSHNHRIGNTAFFERAFTTNRISATRFEALCKCNFNFFCDKVLDINKPIKHGLTPMETGNIMHFILQNILEYYSKFDDNFERFIKAQSDEINSLIKVQLENYKEINFIDEFINSKRFDYNYSLFLDVAKRLIVSFQDEFSVSKFRPKYFEMSIMPSEKSNSQNIINPITIKFTTKNNTEKEFFITGKVDRIDVMENGENNEKFLRVIDYKTGTIDFNLSAVKSGINTQMLIYLFSICNDDSNYKPAGVLYYKVGAENFIAESREISDEEIEKAWRKKYMTVGLISDDNRITEDQKNLDKFIKAKVNADNRTKFFDTSQRKQTEIEQIKKYCINYTQSKLKDFLNGEIEALPTKVNKSSPCKFCDYIAFCRKNKNKITIDTKLDKIAFTNLDGEISKEED